MTSLSHELDLDDQYDLALAFRIAQADPKIFKEFFRDAKRDKQKTTRRDYIRQGRRDKGTQGNK